MARQYTLWDPNLGNIPVPTAMQAALVAGVGVALTVNADGSITITASDVTEFGAPPALGNVTPNAVHATTFDVTGAVALSPANANVVLSPTGTGVVTVNPATAGTMDNVAVGGTTPLAVTATALTATGAVALSPANHNVVLSPTGTGVVTVNPATAGTMDNVALGVTTPLAVHATTLSATAAVALSPANAAVVLSPTGSGVVTVNPATAGTMDNVALGVTTPLAVHATTLSTTTVGTFVCNGVTPVSVTNANVTANSVIIITLKSVGGTVGATPHVATITPTTGFTTVGTASDSSTYNYAIIN